MLLLMPRCSYEQRLLECCKLSGFCSLTKRVGPWHDSYGAVHVALRVVVSLTRCSCARFHNTHYVYSMHAFYESVFRYGSMTYPIFDRDAKLLIVGNPLRINNLPEIVRTSCAAALERSPQRC